MITTLKPKEFIDFLCQKRSSNMDELRWHATNFIQMKELYEFHDKFWGDQKKPDPHKEKQKSNKEKVFKRQPC